MTTGRKMKKIIVVLAVAVALCLPHMAVADTVKSVGTGGTYSGYGPYQTGIGGEFTLLPGGFAISGYSANTSNLGGFAGTFQTFCLEKNEYISAGVLYNVVLNSMAVNGGTGGPNPDPLSVGSAYLYEKFATGTLAGYNYGAGRAGSAAQLQNAFWMLEGDIAYSNANTYIALVEGLFAGQAGAIADYTGGSVKVLNLTLPNGQDQLVYVPEPSTFILLGLGMIGMAGVRRKMKR